MTGLDQAVAWSLGGAALLLSAGFLPVLRRRAATPGEIRDRGCALLFLGAGLIFVGLLALLALLLPWRWAKYGILVALFWLPASMLFKGALGGIVDGIGRLVKKR